ncbi:CU044_5270 family protein [Streptomyces phyllanthi]|uniref:Tat pathway signal protein n=1 Tax=Streptomyces phyllanthi TaxID=1803180 RepID=A0A5N8WDI0_9ACTN|nr:CU044_5270 family protein [Streptomyces phyllanthi]MPY44454.1 hypothetical protein [Streptomyces phyllanthi]
MRDIDELRELRDFTAGTPPLDDETRRRARARLFAAMAEPAPVVRPRRRPVLRIALTGAVAASVAAGVLVAVRDDGGTGRTATLPATSSPALRNVSAQTVLNGAAAYERKHEQTVSPQDDQFIYTREIIKETDQKTGATKSYVDENWRSVDDSQSSWVMELGKGWWSPPLEEDQHLWPPQDWDTLEKLPTDPEKLILRLVYGPDDKNHSLDEITETQWAGDIHRSLTALLKLVPVMPEGLRPAAYEALGMVPGVKVVPNQKDAKGRTGVAITYNDPRLPEGAKGFGGRFIFAPDTYRFLGFRDERDSGDGKNRKTYTQLSYLDTWAIVDKARQRP